MILEQAGIPFTVVESSYREQPQPGCCGQALVALHARGKADGASPEGAAAVLGVDTVVELAAAILGKPADRTEAAGFLRRLSGAEHRVHSGLHLRAGGRRIDAVETTTVRSRRWMMPMWSWYLDTDEWIEPRRRVRYPGPRSGSGDRHRRRLSERRRACPCGRCWTRWRRRARKAVRCYSANVANRLESPDCIR